MSKIERKNLTIQQKLEINTGADEFQDVSYRTNIRAGDYLVRSIMHGEKVESQQFYEVARVGDRFVKVQFRHGGSVKTGTLAIPDLFGTILPAPDLQVMICYSLFNVSNLTDEEKKNYEFSLAD